MPKELIHNRYPELDPDLQVRVGWNREAGHVEIATVAADDRKLEEITPDGNGWFVQLDRAGINRLILVLRRARDAAYGRDEPATL